MSTQPPNTHPVGNTSTAAAMAVAQPKPKSAAKANANPTTKQKMQMHRRSRTGCYTCRLRRKKCDEGSPCCSACKNLGLRCEYKRPMWWSNNDQRRLQKDQIKMIIKRKKLTEKNPHPQHSQVLPPGPETPPGLSHSLPTSATFSDPMSRTRSASIDSHYSFQEFDFSAPPAIVDYTAYNAQMHSSHSQYAPVYPEYSPYDIDVKTERQMFVNDVPTRRESTISTFSTFHPPQHMLPSYPIEEEWAEDVYDSRRPSLADEAFNTNVFDFAHGPTTTSRRVEIELDENDQVLLDHFIADVLPTIFPILETNQHGSARTDLVLPALETNKSYLHCCLSIAAEHLKSNLGYQGEQIDNDIVRLRYATISDVCEALNNDQDHQQPLETVLSVIFFQTCVGRFDDSLPDISWHQHFQAVVSLVQKLELPRIITEMLQASELQQTPQPTPFSMTLTAWIDILGATMQVRAPTFAHSYREKHLATTQAGSSLGLRELMGCEDRVMYLISEIACLEALKRDGMDDIQLCQHVHSLGDQIGLTELSEGGAMAAAPKIPFNANGVLSPRQLSKNITAAFRLAARIYLCSLVPGFSPSQASCMGLVEKLASVIEFIPSGLGGYDRSLVWVYLIGGSVATAGSSFRALFQERIVGLGELSNVGSFGRVMNLLCEVWQKLDEQLVGQGSPREDATPQQQQQELQHVSWREVMQSKGWDFLLI